MNLKKWYNNRTATEKGAFITGIFLLTIACISIAHQRSQLIKENRNLETTLSTKDEEIVRLKQERDKYELQLAPFLAAANQNFPEVPQEERLSLLSNKIDEILDTFREVGKSMLFKLSEVEKAIDDLQLLSQRVLSESAVRQLRTNLGELIPLKVVIECTIGDNEAYVLAQQIKAIFTEVGWKVEGVDQALYRIPQKFLKIIFSDMPSRELQRALVPLVDDFGYPRHASINDNLSDNSIRIIVGSR